MKILYTVKNETLNDISVRFGINKKTILDTNKTSAENVRDGKILLLDTLDGETYKVRPKDTLYTIANKHNVSAEALKAFNNLSEVFVGELIRIPRNNSWFFDFKLPFPYRK